MFQKIYLCLKNKKIIICQLQLMIHQVYVMINPLTNNHLLLNLGVQKAIHKEKNFRSKTMRYPTKHFVLIQKFLLKIKKHIIKISNKKNLLI